MFGRNRKSKGLLSSSTLLLVVSYALIGCEGITEVAPENVLENQNSGSGNNQALIYTKNPAVLNNYPDFLSQNSFNFPSIANKLTTKFITSENTLQSFCDFKQNTSATTYVSASTSNKCQYVVNDTKITTLPIQKPNNSWRFSNYSDSFYQVNTFYHIDLITKRFLASLKNSHKKVHFEGTLEIPPATKSNLAQTASYWLTQAGATASLKVASKCQLPELNAYFSPADNEICLGYDPSVPNFLLAQDPSIIYHEMGHALVKVMLNQRNITHDGVNLTTQPLNADLGSIFYDEAGSINEGIADYFSYYMNQRKRVGEWALGRLQGSPRPMTESDPAHDLILAERSGERLTYPKHILTDHASPDDDIDFRVEDIHTTGQVVSHYLVALTEALKSAEAADKNNCSITATAKTSIHEEATDLVFMLLNETLAEVGDLTAKGSDFLNEAMSNQASQQNVYFTNLNEQESFMWTHVVNPPNFRRFFRIFAKNIHHHISKKFCVAFTKDESEQLLDDFGLLLFRSYEDKGNGFDIANIFQVFYNTYNTSFVFSNTNQLFSFGVNTQVNEVNRRNTILIPKDFIKLDQVNGIGFVFDSGVEIRDYLAELTFEGRNVATSTGLAGFEFNNDDSAISRGEVLGLSLNLLNDSNTEMGGVQFLANDWDHMKLRKPTSAVYTDADPNNDPPYNYVNREVNTLGISNNIISGFTGFHEPCTFNNFPSSSEGGVTDSDDTIPGNCSHLSKTNYDIDKSNVIADVVYSKHELDSPQPICMAQYNDENETKWVSQDFFRQYGISGGLQDKDCLNNPSLSGDDFNPNECLIRFLPGAQQAVLGKIDPQQNWFQTMTSGSNESKGEEFKFPSSSIVLMEVNKLISPGTRFNCRFRVRFTNCSDCYDKNTGGSWKDNIDFEYTGHEAFKVINFTFEVKN